MLLSDASPILSYLRSWSHFLEDEPVGDVLFKLVFLETKQEEKPFTSLCQQHMGEKAPLIGIDKAELSQRMENRLMKGANLKGCPIASARKERFE